MDASLRFTAPAAGRSCGDIEIPPAEVEAGRAGAPARTRAKVLTAARMLFGRHPYATVTIRMLAREMGMSTGAVFAHFPDKAEVWRAAMECEPPLDGPVVRAAFQLQSALRGLIAIKPRDGGGAFDPDQVAAWAAAEAALALSEGRT